RLLAETVVWVAREQVAPRNAMEREQQPPTRLQPAGAPVLLDRGAQRLDVRGFVVPAVDEAQLWNPAPALQLARHAIEHTGRGGGGILRIKRQHDDAADVRFPQLRERSRKRGRAIGHAEGDHGIEIPRELLLEGGRNRSAMQHERRPLGGPDLTVRVSAPGWPDPQDQPVQRQPPQPARRLDDARVPQELGEEPPYGRSGRRLGRTEICDQYSHPVRSAVRAAVPE